MDPNFDDTQNDAKAAAIATWRRELERKSQDTIKVFNPLNQSYTVVWNSYEFTTPAQSTANYPRYLAEKFVKEVVDKILTYRVEVYIHQVNLKRRSQGQDSLKPRERREIEMSQGFNISNRELRRTWVAKIWQGLVEEYGRNQSQNRAMPKRDLRPVDEQLIEEIDRLSLDNDQPIQSQPSEAIDDIPVEPDTFVDSNLIDIDIDQGQVDSMSASPSGTNVEVQDPNLSPVNLGTDVPGQLGPAPEQLLPEDSPVKPQYDS